MLKSLFFALLPMILVVFNAYPIFGATVFYQNGAFTPNGIEWCEENQALFELLGGKFYEHHNHSIESRVCGNLIQDDLWTYSGPDRVEKLIERSRYFSELEIAESEEEAKVGVLDPTPADVPDRLVEQEKQEEMVREEQVQEEQTVEQNNVEEIEENGGGCLIATAAFDSELSTDVQMLREVRDVKVANTYFGTMFMSGFNQFYYSFSPAVADAERQSPLFKEFVKILITPMLATLSLLNHVEIESETDMLAWGTSIILLNVGIYFGVPIVAVIKLKQKLLV